jgi:carbon monoxide dehydrogenase subunit G
MKMEGEYTFNGPREDVWEIIRDPDVLATALPGTQSLELVGENEYEGEMKVRIGPVAGTFGGKLTVSNEIPPESYTLTVEGRGKVGFLKGIGDIEFVDLGDSTTLMKYGGEVQIGGRVASVGQRLFDMVSKNMIKQGLDKLDEALQAHHTAESED